MKRNILLNKIIDSQSYQENLKKVKTSFLNKNEMSLVKVLAATVFIDNEVSESEVSKVKDILEKLYDSEKSKILLTAVIEKINFYRNNVNCFEQDKQLVHNLVLKNNIYFNYMKSIFSSNTEFSPEEKIFYFSIKNSNDFKYEKLNPKLLKELQMRYEEDFKPKLKQQCNYYPTPTF